VTWDIMFEDYDKRHYQSCRYYIFLSGGRVLYRHHSFTIGNPVHSCPTPKRGKGVVRGVSVLIELPQTETL